MDQETAQSQETVSVKPERGFARLADVQIEAQVVKAGDGNAAWSEVEITVVGRVETRGRVPGAWFQLRSDGTTRRARTIPSRTENMDSVPEGTVVRAHGRVAPVAPWDLEIRGGFHAGDGFGTPPRPVAEGAFGSTDLTCVHGSLNDGPLSRIAGAALDIELPDGRIFMGNKPQRPGRQSDWPASGDQKALIHVTHWKAGSQWIRAIFEPLYDRKVVPGASMDQVMTSALYPDAFYPTVYLAQGQLARVPRALDMAGFVVIRDARDTLVSLYHSEIRTHRITSPAQRRRRIQLQELSQEDGLLRILRGKTMSAISDIQRSWIGGPWPVIRYEDLLDDTYTTLRRALGEIGVAIEEQALRSSVEANSFENLSGGRQPGQEDQSSHYRKGVADDWKNYFTPELKQEFRRRFGDLLRVTGYEDGDDW